MASLVCMFTTSAPVSLFSSRQWMVEYLVKIRVWIVVACVLVNKLSLSHAGSIVVNISNTGFVFRKYIRYSSQKVIKLHWKREAELSLVLTASGSRKPDQRCVVWF